MHAGYQTIRQDSMIIKQKSLLGIFENWRIYGKKNCQKSTTLQKRECLTIFHGFLAKTQFEEFFKTDFCLIIN